jgi:hypothetical protein
MKILNLIVGFLTLIIVGCSSTYRLSDFPSKKKFYEDFNKSAKNESLRIVLKNDSTIAAEYGAEISNDSLILNKFITKEQTIRRDEIKEIEYGAFNMTMRLKNGKSFELKSNKILSDSLILVLYYEPEYLPINKVNLICYKAHWAAVPAGIGLGIVSGFFIGSILIPTDDQDDGVIPSSFFLGLVSGFTVGLISGGIVGYIIGDTYIYEFSTKIGSPP